jgi:hypothetical protein
VDTEADEGGRVLRAEVEHLTKVLPRAQHIEYQGSVKRSV